MTRPASRRVLLALAGLLVALPLILWTMPDQAPAASEVPSFPGAMGFGASTPGGRGGPVVPVVTLADSGMGSLRWALEKLSGPRIVIFAISGEIALKSQIQIGSSVTIAGHSAPAPGITISGARLQVTGDDVIIRGLRLRPGTGPGQDLDARDAISVGAEDRTVSRVMIDGNSFTWATDENVAVWYKVQDVTLSHNIVAEALNDAGHPKGKHSMGMLIGGEAKRISVLRNLLANNHWRNPQIKNGVEVEFVNNLVTGYGPGGLSAAGSPTAVDVINNVFRAGLDTPEPYTRPAIRLLARGEGDRVFVSGNQTPMGTDTAEGQGLTQRMTAPVIDRQNTPVLPTQDVEDHVLANAGARAPTLDPVDQRIVDEARVRLGRIVDAPPTQPAAIEAATFPSPPLDSDGDGIPDAAEQSFGLDPETRDSHLLAKPGGYAYIEIYLNGRLARH